MTRKHLLHLIDICKKTKNWTRVEQANVYKIDDLSDLFYEVKGIGEINLSSWDTRYAKYMNRMFFNSDFNSPIYFDTSKVVDMTEMFAGSKYNQSVDCFNTSNVEDMFKMFWNSSFNKTIDNFDLSLTKDIRWMFSDDYYHPFLSAKKCDNIFLRSNCRGFNKVLKMHKRNQSLFDLLNHGNFEKIEILLKYFQYNHHISSKIKKLFVQRDMEINKKDAKKIAFRI